MKEIQIENVYFAVMDDGRVRVSRTDKGLVQTRRIVFTESPNVVNLKPQPQQLLYNHFVYKEYIKMNTHIRHRRSYTCAK